MLFVLFFGTPTQVFSHITFSDPIQVSNMRNYVGDQLICTQIYSEFNSNFQFKIEDNQISITNVKKSSDLFTLVHKEYTLYFEDKDVNVLFGVYDSKVLIIYINHGKIRCVVTSFEDCRVSDILLVKPTDFLSNNLKEKKYEIIFNTQDTKNCTKNIYTSTISIRYKKSNSKNKKKKRNKRTRQNTMDQTTKKKKSSAEKKRDTKHSNNSPLSTMNLEVTAPIECVDYRDLYKNINPITVKDGVNLTAHYKDFSQTYYNKLFGKEESTDLILNTNKEPIIVLFDHLDSYNKYSFGKNQDGFIIQVCEGESIIFYAVPYEYLNISEKDKITTYEVYRVGSIESAQLSEGKKKYIYQLKYKIKNDNYINEENIQGTKEYYFLIIIRIGFEKNQYDK